MSDRMRVTDAQTYLDTWSAGDSVDMWKVRAARTVVAQAEQIETLSHLLAGAEQAAISRAEQIERLQNALREGVGTYILEIPDLVRDGHLLPGDMEPPA